MKPSTPAPDRSDKQAHLTVGTTAGIAVATRFATRVAALVRHCQCIALVEGKKE